MTRTVLVTGGGTGIGRAVAERFAASGDSVVVTGRRREPLERTAKELGDRVSALVCDSTDAASLTEALTALPARIDVLVNNSGGNTDVDLPAPDDLESYARTWRANLDANLLGAAMTTRAVSDRLAAGGAVVHIGSIAADNGAGAYGAAKAGLASWNIDLAGELGARDITANVVSCGYIADTEFFRDRMTDERRARLVDNTFVKRAGKPADVAGVVHFLASPDARHVTGQVLRVNGGASTTR